MEDNMSYLERKLCQVKDLNIKIKKILQELSDIEQDINIISAGTKYKIGQRVHLIDNWSNKKVGSGWEHCKYFMIPENIATIVDIECYKKNITYLLRFDREGYICTWGEDKGKEKIIKDKHIFGFKEADITLFI